MNDTVNVRGAALDHAGDLVPAALRREIDQLAPPVRLLARYHLGWCDSGGNAIGNATASNPGKLIRSSLTMLAAQAVGVSAEVALPGAVAVELVHNFSLLHDDVMDRDQLRRHRPAVWSLWGNSAAILAGDALLALAHQVLLAASSPHQAEAGVLLSTTVQGLIQGQLADLSFERRDNVALAECLAMAAGKTAELLTCSATIGAVLGGVPAAAVRPLSAFSYRLGLAFQFVDDVLGIWGDSAVTGKPAFADLQARKKSLPIVWALTRGGSVGDEIATRMRSPAGADDGEFAGLAELIERSGAKTWALSESRRLIAEAEKSLAELTIAPRHRDELMALALSLIERDS